MGKIVSLAAKVAACVNLNAEESIKLHEILYKILEGKD